MAYLGAHIECRCSRMHGADVTFTDVTIKTPDRTGDVNDVMPRRTEDFGIWRKAVSWDLNSEWESWDLSLEEGSWCLVSPWWDQLGSTKCATHGGVRWKSQDRKKLCLSLMSKNLQLKKEIKSFVPEPKESH